MPYIFHFFVSSSRRIQLRLGRFLTFFPLLYTTLSKRERERERGKRGKRESGAFSFSLSLSLSLSLSPFNGWTDGWSMQPGKSKPLSCCRRQQQQQQQQQQPTHGTTTNRRFWRLRYHTRSLSLSCLLAGEDRTNQPTGNRGKQGRPSQVLDVVRAPRFALLCSMGFARCGRPSCRSSPVWKTGAHNNRRTSPEVKRERERKKERKREVGFLPVGREFFLLVRKRPANGKHRSELYTYYPTTTTNRRKTGSNNNNINNNSEKVKTAVETH